MRKRYFFIFTLAVAVLLAGHLYAQDHPCTRSQTDASGCKGEHKVVSMDYEGNTLYFCCTPDLEKFKSDPAKYYKAMTAKGMTFGSGLKPQETCPVMGNKINRDVFVNIDGVTIFACCAGCLDKIKADPAHHVKVLQERGETPVLCLSKGGCCDKSTCGKPCPKAGTSPCTRSAEQKVEPKT
jgi:YHS domain-containing protein